MADVDDGETQHDQLPAVDEILVNKRRDSSACKKILINLGILACFTTIFLAGLILGLKQPWLKKNEEKTQLLLQKNEEEQKGEIGEYITKQDLVDKGIALEYGQEFNDPTSYQSRALEVMKKHSVITSFIYTEDKLAQRYALLCLYFQTNRVRTDVTDEHYGYGTTPQWKNAEPWNFPDDECSWYGIACNIFGMVIRIELPNHLLTGYIPTEIKHLADGPIYSIDFSGNGGLGQGGFPSVFLEFSGLELLDLSGCNFDGSVPLAMCDKDIKYFIINCECSCTCCQSCI
jgi:hypothetical protein